MLISDKIINAINLASILHKTQVRKGINETPYISHLFAVSMILKSVTDDEDIIIAGLMHDSLEDVPDYTYDMLIKDCGPRVADIVLGVTEDKKLSYKDRKVSYLKNLKTGKVESVLVSLADKLHNLKSLASLKQDEKYNTDFLQTQIMLYKEVLEIGRDRLKNKNGDSNVLVLALEKELEDF